MSSSSSRRSLSYALTDSTTMLGRQLRHMLRYPAMTGIILGVPVVFLLIFVYVFGGRSEPDSVTPSTAVPSTSGS